MFLFFLGLFVGILLSAVAIVWDSSRQRPTLVWMDENYKIHLVKKRK